MISTHCKSSHDYILSAYTHTLYATQETKEQTSGVHRLLGDRGQAEKEGHLCVAVCFLRFRCCPVPVLREDLRKSLHAWLNFVMAQFYF